MVLVKEYIKYASQLRFLLDVCPGEEDWISLTARRTIINFYAHREKPTNYEEFVVFEVKDALPKGLTGYMNVVNYVTVALSLKTYIICMCEKFPQIAETVLYSAEMQLLDGQIDSWIANRDANVRTGEMDYIRDLSKIHPAHDWLKRWQIRISGAD